MTNQQAMGIMVATLMSARSYTPDEAVAVAIAIWNATADAMEHKQVVLDGRAPDSQA